MIMRVQSLALRQLVVHPRFFVDCCGVHDVGLAEVGKPVEGIHLVEVRVNLSARVVSLGIIGRMIWIVILPGGKSSRHFFKLLLTGIVKERIYASSS